MARRCGRCFSHFHGFMSTTRTLSLSPSENANTYPQVLVAMVLGVLFSVCWLQLMKRFARVVIQCVIFTGW